MKFDLNEAEARAELIDPALAAAGWGGNFYFSTFVLLYTLMHNYLFPTVNSLFIVCGNKTRQGYVRKHTLKPAGYSFHHTPGTTLSTYQDQPNPGLLFDLKKHPCLLNVILHC